MIREIRLERIRQELAKQGIIDGDEIADLLDVSRATIRRDLDALEEMGHLKRTHGGAIAIDPKNELPFFSKLSVSGTEKREIGIKAASLIPEGAVIGCTGGTTVMGVMKAIGDKKLTVVTNAINIAMELAVIDSVQVVVTGGALRSHSYELVGPEATDSPAPLPFRHSDSRRRRHIARLRNLDVHDRRGAYGFHVHQSGRKGMGRGRSHQNWKDRAGPHRAAFENSVSHYGRGNSRRAENLA